MYIQKIILYNYRRFRELEISFKQVRNIFVVSAMA